MKKVGLGQSTSCVATKYIGSDIDKILNVADNLEDVVATGDAIKDIKAVANIAGDVTQVSNVANDVVEVSKVANVIPQIPDLVTENKAIQKDIDAKAVQVTQDKQEVETNKQAVDVAKAGADKDKADAESAKNDAQKALAEVQQIVKDTLYSGGVFTPKAGAEYPDVSFDPKQDVSYAISLANRNDKYTFTTGNLTGQVVMSGDQLLYRNNTKTWDLVLVPTFSAELAGVLNTIYPVGHVLLTTNQANPNTYLGIGTWKALDADSSVVVANINTKIDTFPKAVGSDIVKVPLPKHSHTTKVEWGPKNAEYAQHTHDAGSYRVLAFCRFTSLQVDRGTEIGGIVYTHEFEGEGFTSGNGFKYPDMYAVDHEKVDQLPIITPLVKLTDKNKLPLSRDVRHLFAIDRSVMYDRSTTSRLVLDATKNSGFTGNSGNPTSEHKHDFTIHNDPSGDDGATINVSGKHLKVYAWVRVS